MRLCMFVYLCQCVCVCVCVCVSAHVSARASVYDGARLLFCVRAHAYVSVRIIFSCISNFHMERNLTDTRPEASAKTPDATPRGLAALRIACGALGAAPPPRRPCPR